MKFEDVYIQQALRENVPKIRDMLKNAETVSFSSSGSVLSQEVRIPICAEAMILKETNIGRFVFQVSVGNRNAISHRACADSKILELNGKNYYELKESYQSAGACVEFLLDALKRDMLEYLAKELRKKEKELSNP